MPTDADIVADIGVRASREAMLALIRIVDAAPPNLRLFSLLAGLASLRDTIDEKMDTLRGLDRGLYSSYFDKAVAKMAESRSAKSSSPSNG